MKDRKGYEDLRKAIAEKSLDVLVFDRQDRLARDQMETLSLIVDCARAGIMWHSVDEGLLNLSDPMQLLMTIFRGGEAEGYSRKISENQKRSNASKRAKGLPSAGPRPFGFEDDKITPKPDEAALIKLGTELALSGKTRYEILTVFRASGIFTPRGKNTWHVATVVSLLTRWRNAGYVEHNEEPYGPAVWEPIIADDKDTALQMVRDVRAIFAGPVVPGVWSKPAVHLAAGIAQCHCGRQLISSKNLGEPIYRCIQQVVGGKGGGAGHVTIRNSIVDPLIIKEMVRVYFDEPELQSTEATDELGKLYATLAQTQEKIARLLDIYTDGDLTKVEYGKRVTPLRVKETETQTAIADLAKNNTHTAMLIESRKALADRYETYPNTAPSKDYPNVTRGAFRVEDELEAAFLSLSLEDQRRLVASSLKIVVSSGGRGPSRVKITHNAVAPAVTRTESAVAVYA